MQTSLAEDAKGEEGEEGGDCFHKASVVSDWLPGDDEHGAGKAVLIGSVPTTVLSRTVWQCIGWRSPLLWLEVPTALERNSNAKT
ncbi:unnamed protein product [Arctogadus glacialis]